MIVNCTLFNVYQYLYKIIVEQKSIYNKKSFGLVLWLGRYRIHSHCPFSTTMADERVHNVVTWLKFGSWLNSVTSHWFLQSVYSRTVFPVGICSFNFCSMAWILFPVDSRVKWIMSLPCQGLISVITFRNLKNKSIYWKKKSNKCFYSLKNYINLFLFKKRVFH